MSKRIESVTGSLMATKHRDRYRVRQKVTYVTGEFTYKEFSGKTKKDAIAKATAFRNTFFETRNNRVSQEALRNFRDSMQEYVERHRFPKVKRTSYDLIIQNLNNQIYPALENYTVCDIDSNNIRDILTGLCLKGYSYSIIKKTYNNLNNYFSFLKRNGDIERNPLDQIERPTNKIIDQQRSNLGVDTTNINNEKIEEFSDEEIAKLKEAVKDRFKNGKKKHAQAEAFILLLNSGLRTGEVLALKNKNIDLENRRMLICENLTLVQNRDGVKQLPGKRVNIGTTKNRRERVVPLNQACVDAINELRKERDGGKDSFLLCDEKGKPINPLAFRKRFYNLQKHAGIEPKGLHSLRHTFATRLASGAPGRTPLSVAQIAEILGQNTEFVTQRYLHLRNHVTELTDGFEF